MRLLAIFTAITIASSSASAEVSIHEIINWKYNNPPGVACRGNTVIVWPTEQIGVPAPNHPDVQAALRAEYKAAGVAARKVQDRNLKLEEERTKAGILIAEWILMQMHKDGMVIPDSIKQLYNKRRAIDGGATIQ